MYIIIVKHIMNVYYYSKAYNECILLQNKEIIHHGIIVHTPTEESVFKYLGIPYRPPEERDHE